MIENHHDRPPFERHKTYYLVLKIAVLAAAAYLALSYLGAV